MIDTITIAIVNVSNGITALTKQSYSKKYLTIIWLQNFESEGINNCNDGLTHNYLISV
jgi:hypothetical protein